MKFNVENISYKSHRYNEDRIVIKDNLFVVMDGASSLVKTDVFPTSGSWFVSKIKKELLKKHSNTLNQLSNISKKCYLEYPNNQNLYLPSCGMAIAKIIDDHVDISVIGDCEVMCIDTFNNYKIIKCNDLEKLDKEAIDELKSIAKQKKINVIDATKYIKETLIKNRQLMNKINGYNIFTISQDPNFVFLNETVNLENLKMIYIYSDGFSQGFYSLNTFSIDDMLNCNFDIKEAKDNIIKTWNNDKLLNKYPRFKFRDDISVVKIVF